MKITIELKKIGTSRGFVIPKSFLTASGIKEGQEFSLESTDDGEIKLSLVENPHQFILDYFKKNPSHYVNDGLLLGESFDNDFDVASEDEDFTNVF